MEVDFWKDKYPEGIPREVDTNRYANILDVLKEACIEYADKPAFTSLRYTITYGELYKYSSDFAAYLQNHTDLKVGDRIALQMPNVIQYPIAIFGAMRAGLIVVNTNPLYTAKEMEHQFNDSGATALLCLANMAHLAEKCLPNTGIKTVIITELGDVLPTFKRLLINNLLKFKKLVPAYRIPGAITYRQAMSLGKDQSFTEHKPQSDDTVVLQYTGGTTGVAKGAMLTHRNLIANMLQCEGLVGDQMSTGKEMIIAPLPLYHIYAFTCHCMLVLASGNHNILIANPRDTSRFAKELGRYKFTYFVGLNTLFSALCDNEDFQKIDFSSLHLTLSGGMALQNATVKRWKEITGSDIYEGYGMTETSPVVSVNPYQAFQLGTIGIPVPSTLCKIIDDAGNTLPIGERGELCVKGPQVMKGYWNRPEATAEVIDAEGYLKTGDVALIQPDGYIKLVDRKKDMIIVSGFNVYPNELEDVLASHPSVSLCAAIGIPDEKSGEVVKMFVVTRPGQTITKDQVIEFMREQLTGYKLPKEVEFRSELPTTIVGKILRRELRDSELKKSGSKA